MAYDKKSKRSYKKRSKTSKTYRGTRRNWTTTKTLPRVYNSGRYTAKRTMLFTRLLRSISELKINNLEPVDCALPSPIVAPPGVTAVYKAQYNIGPGIPAWSGYNALGSTDFTQGVGSSNRVGRYMYLRNTLMRVKISMDATPDIRVNPIRFRVIVFKSRRNNILSTVPNNPENNLFINTQGDRFGVNTVGLEPMDYESSIVNKKNYVVVKDQQFILQPIVNQPQGEPMFASAGVYKNEKYMYFNLGHYKKVSMDTQNNPSDYNYQYALCVLATPVSSCRTAAKNWTISIRGTTSAYDN